jgi:hypothetical protein
MRLLHRDHDPNGALKLLTRYVQLYPNGDLLEESLALTIEAKSLQGDADAGKLGAEYLRRFPSGRFTEAARAAQQRFAK